MEFDIVPYGTWYQQHLQSQEMSYLWDLIVLASFFFFLGLKVSICVPCCNWTDLSGKAEVQQAVGVLHKTVVSHWGKKGTSQRIENVK